VSQVRAVRLGLAQMTGKVQSPHLPVCLPHCWAADSHLSWWRGIWLP